MSLQTVDIYGVSLDVYYEITKERDPYGTGDSPTMYEIIIESIETTSDTQDLTELLTERVIELISKRIIELESENG